MSDTTIELRGIQFDVEFDYQPPEPEERHHSDGGGYPGCAASLEVTMVSFKGHDFWEFFKDDTDEIAEAIYDQYINQPPDHYEP